MSGRWIPATQPPEVDKYESKIVIAVVCGSVYNGRVYEQAAFVAKGYYHWDGTWTIQNGIIGYPVVTHWQPLPELPPMEEIEAIKKEVCNETRIL